MQRMMDECRRMIDGFKIGWPNDFTRRHAPQSERKKQLAAAAAVLILMPKSSVQYDEQLCYSSAIFSHSNHFLPEKYIIFFIFHQSMRMNG